MSRVNMLDVDLKTGIIPVTRAASQLTGLIKQSKITSQPVVLTQNGYPTGVIMDIDLFTRIQKIIQEIIPATLEKNPEE